MENSNNNIICGRNPVLEALRSGREIDRLFVAHGTGGGSVTAIIAKCRAKGILIKEISPQKLDYYCGGANHQGVAVMFASQEYATVDDMFALAETRGEKPFLIICDEIEDPHNLGALIRCAEGAGAHGLIIPKRRSAGLTSVVCKASAGAFEHLAIAKVANIASALDELKQKNIWVIRMYGAAARQALVSTVLASYPG